MSDLMDFLSTLTTVSAGDSVTFPDGSCGDVRNELSGWYIRNRNLTLSHANHALISSTLHTPTDRVWRYWERLRQPWFAGDGDWPYARDRDKLVVQLRILARMWVAIPTGLPLEGNIRFELADDVMGMLSRSGVIPG